MNIELREFQEAAVGRFVRELRKAAREAREGDLQAVSLSSPTGSGKTIMLIDAIERIIEGDEQNAPSPDATFLWITDQPELNLQTREKMLAFSTVLTSAVLTVLDTEFDAEQLSPGQLYFLNTQKLGRNSSLIATGDRRAFSLWDTLNNTAHARPGSFYVIIDEAHRGMAQSTQARNEANSIIQKFMLGDPGLIQPVPLIVGISATPQRFTDLLSAAQRGSSPRTTRPVVIEPADVRSSGLIKDAIQFVHPAETQPSDMTLLRAAVASWRDYQKHWSEYCTAQGEPNINPLMAVQVTDGTGNTLSRTDLAEAISCIEAVAGTLPADAMAHSFQDKADLEIGGRRVRYIAPSDITADQAARIVFFKSSLTTGWDCPRAEVMMSFRPATDATHIAQLVGRMVRTPLVRRIEADEHLNTVSLYLPHYDRAGLEEVVRKLTDGELAPPTELRTEPAAVLSRAENSDALFAALSTLPSHSIPRASSANETKRVMRLALRLSMDGLRLNAPEEARQLLLGVINAAHDRLKDTPAFKAIVEVKDTLDIHLVSYLYGEDTESASQSQNIRVSPENIEDLFEAAGRKIGEGLHRDWRTQRVADTGIDPRTAKLEFVALATPDLKRELDGQAKQKTRTWMVIYQDQIGDLPEAKRQAYDDIRGLATEPEQVPLVLPQVIEAKIEGTTWDGHLYVDEHGQFQADLNGWEAPIILEEIRRNDFLGWLRVVPRKPWALTIPYQSGGKIKPVFVDFLVVREGEQGPIVDIVDPHDPTRGDAADKLAGLAGYAERHGAAFGRIESIIVEGSEIRRLDLQDTAIREQAKNVKSTSDVLRLFDKAAVSPPTA